MVIVYGGFGTQGRSHNVVEAEKGTGKSVSRDGVRVSGGSERCAI